jgi:hypothetical protein
MGNLLRTPKGKEDGAEDEDTLSQASAVSSRQTKIAAEAENVQRIRGGKTMCGRDPPDFI